MKERILAVLGAIALVAAAFVARTLIVGDDTGGNGGAGGGGGGGRPVVACTPDLMAVCDALVADGRIADDPPSLDLGDETMTDQKIDGWITWDPAPRIANFDAEEVGTAAPWDTAIAVGTEPLALLVRASQRDPLLASCGGELTWVCLAGPANVPSIGVGQPSSAEGLARLAPIAKALDPDDVNEVDSNALRIVVAGPVGGQASAADQTQGLVTRGQGVVGSVVGPRRALDAATSSAQGRSSVVVASSPEAPVTVVLAARVGEDLGDLAEQVSAGASGKALETRGVTGDPVDLFSDDLAGFLFQVRAEVG